MCGPAEWGSTMLQADRQNNPRHKYESWFVRSSCKRSSQSAFDIIWLIMLFHTHTAYFSESCSKMTGHWVRSGHKSTWQFHAAKVERRCKKQNDEIASPLLCQLSVSVVSHNFLLHDFFTHGMTMTDHDLVILVGAKLHIFPIFSLRGTGKR